MRRSGRDHGRRSSIGRFRFGRCLPALAVALSAVVLAGCGSSSTAGGGSSSATGTSSTAGSDAAAIAKATKRPSKIVVTTPVDKTIPSHKSIVTVPCSAPNCAVIAAQVKQAAAALGWTDKTINPDGATATADTAAFQEAVATKPSGIIYIAYPEAVIKSGLLAAKAAGIPVVGINAAEPVGSLPGVIAQPANNAAIVKLESAGARLMGLLAKPGDGIAFVEATGFIPVGKVEAGVKAAATGACPSCHYFLKEINVVENSDAPRIIAEFARAHPSIKYIFIVDYATFGVGLQAQLQAEGVTGVKVIAANVNAQGLADVRNGSLFVAGGFDQDTEQAYMAIDALVRHFVGESPAIDDAAPAPYWFTTATAPKSWSPAAVLNTREEFLKLWGK